MDLLWDEARIIRLHSDKIEESTFLEYKSGRALENTDRNKAEISKDVSAMANAAGGTIIYGIEEDPINRHLPGELSPLLRSAASKDWLEMVIHNICPKIQGITILPVVPNADPTRAYYVVEIPQGSTAHQATDKVYYRRHNFRVIPMEDHEVRDVMNRKTVPSVEFKASVCYRQGFNRHRLACKVVNTSSVLAEHSTFILHFPIFLRERFANFDAERFEIEQRDGYSFWRLKPLGKAKSVLFPLGEYSTTFGFELGGTVRSATGQELKSLPWVEYTVFADSMLPLNGRFELADVL